MMINVKVLPDVLAQAKSSGIIGCMILTSEGDLIASSETGTEPQLVGAISANIFGTYQRLAHSVMKDELDNVLIFCSEGLVAVAEMGKFLLCVYGADNAEAGLLKAKVAALRSSLEGPLKEVAASMA
uniref:Roadblock/LAMTOR2 domain-containing protein n=1 Tax=Palpitomonas bilix TaxID=652834 RepID=A0A7S3DBA7_9EUKA|mmetsp:Transcript_29987/g.77380  ORF Transcript_29987/g.77380 Transcript_29987/m.77380 type:complete len:127 (+) Transcript_29987:135-515(+)